MIDLTNKWMNDPKVLAQFGHFFGAYSIVMTAHHIFGKLITMAVIAALIVYAAIKEFWYDAKYEIPTQSVWDNLLDFTFYVLGMIVSGLVVFIL